VEARGLSKEKHVCVCLCEDMRVCVIVYAHAWPFVCTLACALWFLAELCP